MKTLYDKTGIDFRDLKTIKKIIIGIAVVVLLILGIFSYIDKRGGEAVILSDESVGSTVGVEDMETPSNQEPPAAPVSIFVDIAGAVNNPTVAELTMGSRVFDAIEKAGGTTEDADLTAVNRATVLKDGDRIYIPTYEEAAEGGGYIAIPQSAGVSSASGDQGVDAEGRININTADTEVLQRINGVGPATAGKIINYRDEYGSFSAIEDIQNVSGIGPKTFEKMRDSITV